MSQSDEALVRLAQQGNRSAFEDIVRRTSRLVFSRVYLHVADVHSAEDIVQDTFLRAFRAIAELNDAARLRSWLLSIAQNLATDFLRRGATQKRNSGHARLFSLANESTDDSTPATSAEKAELRLKVLEVLRALPEDYQTPLSLRYFSGADYHTIETQMGCSNGSLRGLLHRGMKMMRDRLTKELGEDFFAD